MGTGGILLAAAELEVLSVALRLLHVAAAITVAGAAVFQLVALHPTMATIEESRRREIREAIVARWRPIVLGAIAILLLTGLLNYVLFRIPEYKPHPSKGVYHGLLGVKILLALAAFHAATVLTLPGAKGERYRAQAGGWLRYLVTLFAGIVVIGAVLRNFPQLFG